mmetsp:Transcript_44272/g.140885  ORF Transcript_44272/g.140885 Transcript_44272/m.140885 type:complete len:203 (+) Transcript_44272:246-854(+)
MPPHASEGGGGAQGGEEGQAQHAGAGPSNSLALSRRGEAAPNLEVGGAAEAGPGIPVPHGSISAKGAGAAFKLSWGPTRLPNKIKVRKKFQMGLLRFTVGGDYDLKADELELVARCKDRYFNGQLGLNMHAHQVEYRKVFTGSATRFSVRAACNYAGNSWNPVLGFSVEPIQCAEAGNPSPKSQPTARESKPAGELTFGWET